jgi:hypothetical protein
MELWSLSESNPVVLVAYCIWIKVRKCRATFGHYLWWQIQNRILGSLVRTLQTFPNQLSPLSLGPHLGSG